MKRTTVVRIALLIYSTAALLTLVMPRVAISQELEQENFQVGGLDIGFVPRVYGGVMYYKYSQDAIVTTDLVGGGLEPLADSIEVLKVSTGTTYEAEVTFPIVGGGGTFFINRFFIDVYAQHAFSQSDTSGQDGFVAASDTSISDSQSLFQRDLTSNNIDLERTEWAVSVGYAVTDQFSVFAGYRRADTDFDTKQSGSFTQDAALNPGDLNSRLTNDTTSDLHTEFEQKGPFVGFAYGVPLNQWVFDGVLAFDFAVAFLDGDVVQSQTNGRTTNIKVDGDLQNPSTGTIDNLTVNIDGSAVGVNLGMHWKGLTPIKDLLYMIDIIGHQYDFSADGLNGQVGGQAFQQRGDVNFDEVAISARLGLVYGF